jgi:hypothetical protein
MNNTAPFNFGSGRVTFFDFPFDPKYKFGIEDHLLRENLIQVNYGSSGNLTLDVGWHGDSYEDQSGHFIVCVVKDKDWENPVFEEIAHTPQALFDRVREAVFVAERLGK